MLAKTTTRVEQYTSNEMKERLEQRLGQNIQRYIGADQRTIDQRLAELDKEWSIERAIELEAPTMIGLGVTLGLLHSRKWFALSGFAASMLLMHNTSGFYPMLPVFQRLGFRSQKDIEDERNALRYLRGDHIRYLEH